MPNLIFFLFAVVALVSAQCRQPTIVPSLYCKSYLEARTDVLAYGGGADTSAQQDFEAEQRAGVIGPGCNETLLFFLCAINAPPCLNDGNDRSAAVYKPCKSTCELQMEICQGERAGLNATCAGDTRIEQDPDAACYNFINNAIDNNGGGNSDDSSGAAKLTLLAGLLTFCALASAGVAMA